MVAVIALIVAALVIAGVFIWYAVRMGQAAPPTELRDDEPGPPPDRDREWDPQRRYES